MKIVVIDDDEAILEVIKIILEEQGAKVYPTDGAGNIGKIIRKVNPDLILLDIMLNGADGCQIFKMLRGNSRARNIPIVFLSARNDIAKIARRNRADGYLAKPFDARELILLVQKYNSQGKKFKLKGLAADG